MTLIAKHQKTSMKVNIFLSQPIVLYAGGIITENYTFNRINKKSHKTNSVRDSGGW